MRSNNALLWIIGTIAVLFYISVAYRPLLPIDETRYLTVAWEMRVNHGWFAPLSLNFEPYTHKPPVLFWLINLFWTVFGIGRAQALLPIVIAAGAMVWLTSELSRRLSDDREFDRERAVLVVLGSIPFLIYSTLVLFDLTLAVFVLCALLALLRYSQTRSFQYVAAMALFTGLGLLTKGPVALLYIVFPVILAPLWVRGFDNAKIWYLHALAWLAISFLPVMVWIVPVLLKSDDHFAFWLLWEQTAGRVTGSFKDAHVRPFYFYLPLLPVMFLPWIAFPTCWRSLKKLDLIDAKVRFCLCWFVPTVLAFSLISGKQPHYLMPLLPALLILTMQSLSALSTERLRLVCASLLVVFALTHSILRVTIFPAYDLTPIASFVKAHPESDWAFVRNYHGEIGYLAERTKPIDNLDDLSKLDQWFADHPQGYAMVRYDDEPKVARFEKIISKPHRGRMIGIFRKKP